MFCAVAMASVGGSGIGWGFLLGVVLAFALHEVGHAIGGLLVGAEIRAWGISWKGPYVHVRVTPPCRWRARVSLLSGITVNALLAGACWACGWADGVVINALMVVVNGAPVPGSDGWQALRLAAPAGDVTR
jgi:Zn-dependent protease